MLGFHFDETMSGTFTPEGRDEAPRPLTFTVKVRAASLLRHLRTRSAALEGYVDADGLASHAVLAGTIFIDPLLSRRIRYEFGFTGDDGRAYRFVGQKDVTPSRPIESMTTLPGEITDEAGQRVATALVHFDPKALPSFLGSFRLSR